MTTAARFFAKEVLNFVMELARNVEDSVFPENSEDCIDLVNCGLYWAGVWPTKRYWKEMEMSL